MLSITLGNMLHVRAYSLDLLLHILMLDPELGRLPKP